MTLRQDAIFMHSRNSWQTVDFNYYFQNKSSFLLSLSHLLLHFLLLYIFSFLSFSLFPLFYSPFLFLLLFLLILTFSLSSFLMLPLAFPRDKSTLSTHSRFFWLLSVTLGKGRITVNANLALWGREVWHQHYYMFKGCAAVRSPVSGFSFHFLCTILYSWKPFLATQLKILSFIKFFLTKHLHFTIREEWWHKVTKLSIRS